MHHHIKSYLLSKPGKSSFKTRRSRASGSAEASAGLLVEVRLFSLLGGPKSDPKFFDRVASTQHKHTSRFPHPKATRATS